MSRASFRVALDDLINTHSQENGSDTPDFILGRYLSDCLDAFDLATRRRDSWYRIDMAARRATMHSESAGEECAQSP